LVSKAADCFTANRRNILLPDQYANGLPGTAAKASGVHSKTGPTPATAAFRAAGLASTGTSSRRMKVVIDLALCL
jgi:hypothetical protein